MRVVAYCRVSTNKDEQLDSLESQQQFFNEYSRRNGYNLVKVYADEGKSGTKMKNRNALLKMLSDASRKYFDIVLIKDVSRLARNTVDFLTSIRKLKSLGIKVIFVNYDQTSSDSSEFMLTMLSAIAQEESANTSKRVKFGKKMNVEKGRVPNLVYGYDKIKGDYFNLIINKQESETVKNIFDMYVNKNMGENKIAIELNKMGLKTKRNCKWTQNAVSRILANEIYIGKIINARQEVKDFLTGERKENPEEKWIITDNPKLKIIDEDIFNKVKKIKLSRVNMFNLTGKRKSDKHIFSKLIKCSCCGYSFGRQVRTYQNTYIKWVCSGRNKNGTGSCTNKTVIDESELLDAIKSYFVSVLKDKPNVIKNIINQFNRKYKNKEENQITEKELSSQISKIKKTKQKYIDMFDNDIISISELKDKTANLNKDLKDLEEKLKFARLNISKSDLLQSQLLETFKDVESIVQSGTFTNNLLSRIIENITVDENGKIDVYLKLLSDVGLDNTVQLSDFHTNGTLTISTEPDNMVIEPLLEHLEEEGYKRIEERPQEAESGDLAAEPNDTNEVIIEPQSENVGLTVAMPRESFTDDAVQNLKKLIEAKGNLIKKALAVDSLPIEVDNEKISFPWFPDGQAGETASAYIHFITALCDMAKNQNRVTAKEKSPLNEKYVFRCFLLRLGFIGSKYKKERKILLQNLSGASAFKNIEEKQKSSEKICK